MCTGPGPLYQSRWPSNADKTTVSQTYPDPKTHTSTTARVPTKGPHLKPANHKSWQHSPLSVRHQDDTPTPPPSFRSQLQRRSYHPNIYIRSPVETLGPSLCGPELFATTKTQQLPLWPAALGLRRQGHAQSTQLADLRGQQGHHSGLMFVG